MQDARIHEYTTGDSAGRTILKWRDVAGGKVQKKTITVSGASVSDLQQIADTKLVAGAVYRKDGVIQ